jgi:hypothetical protein
MALVAQSIAAKLLGGEQEGETGISVDRLGHGCISMLH